MEHFFSPNLRRHLRSDAHQSQIIRRDADVDHTQTIGGIQPNYWGIYPPIPPGFRYPCLRYYKSKIQLRYCYLLLIYHTVYKGLKSCLIGFTVIRS